MLQDNLKHFLFQQIVNITINEFKWHLIANKNNVAIFLHIKKAASLGNLLLNSKLVGY